MFKMFTEALKDFDYTWLSLVAMIAFFVAFVVIVFWTYRKSRRARKHYEYMSNLPLDRRNSE